MTCASLGTPSHGTSTGRGRNRHRPAHSLRLVPIDTRAPASSSKRAWHSNVPSEKSEDSNNSRETKHPVVPLSNTTYTGRFRLSLYLPPLIQSSFASTA